MPAAHAKRLSARLRHGRSRAPKSIAARVWTRFASIAGVPGWERFVSCAGFSAFAKETRFATPNLCLRGVLPRRHHWAAWVADRPECGLGARSAGGNLGTLHKAVHAGCPVGPADCRRATARGLREHVGHSSRGSAARAEGPRQHQGESDEVPDGDGDAGDSGRPGRLPRRLSHLRPRRRSARPPRWRSRWRSRRPRGLRRPRPWSCWRRTSWSPRTAAALRAAARSNADAPRPGRRRPWPRCVQRQRCRCACPACGLSGAIHRSDRRRGRRRNARALANLARWRVQP